MFKVKKIWEESVPKNDDSQGRVSVVIRRVARPAQLEILDPRILDLFVF